MRFSQFELRPSRETHSGRTIGTAVPIDGTLPCSSPPRDCYSADPVASRRRLYNRRPRVSDSQTSARSRAEETERVPKCPTRVSSQFPPRKRGRRHDASSSSLRSVISAVCDRVSLLHRALSELPGVWRPPRHSSKIAIFGLRSPRRCSDKMVGSNGTMIAIRLVRSKLRKREEHSNSVHPADVVLQTTPTNNNNNANTVTNNTTTTTATSPAQQNNNCVVQQQQAPVATQQLPADPYAYRGQFLWHYTPPPPSQHMYSNNQVGEEFCDAFTFALVFRVSERSIEFAFHRVCIPVLSIGKTNRRSSPALRRLELFP